MESVVIKSGEGEKRGIYYAPWEKPFDRIFTPFEEFLHRQTTSGLLLIAATILALLLANSGLAGAYYHLTHINLSLTLGGWIIESTLHHWVNDGLMAFFFFVVGLELKREILVGELASLRKAALPIAAAIGGMLVPALIYFALNPEGAAAQGWGVPMATDIAFVIGILVLLGKRIPKALVAFVVALAITDDLGAVIVIALFYTDALSMPALWAAGGFFGVLMLFNFIGVRRPLPYFIIAIFLWLAFFYSGVHPTLAGVLGAFTVPARPKYDPAYFAEKVRKLVSHFENSHQSDRRIITNSPMQATVQSIEDTTLSVMTPLQRLEHIWHLPVAYFVIPVFALFNAGIPLDWDNIGETATHPVMLGIVAGLVGGKFLGIAGASWLALKLGVARLPTDTTFSQVAGVSLLAGIGFTMSIFIGQLAFADDEQLLLIAKTGILGASLIAGVSGYIWLWLAGRGYRQEPADAAAK